MRDVGPDASMATNCEVQALPAHALRQTTDDDGSTTRLEQREARHKTFAQPRHVVVIGKTQQRTQRQAPVLLFSSDLALPYAQLIDDDGRRFQLACNFRAAKQ